MGLANLSGHAGAMTEWCLWLPLLCEQGKQVEIPMTDAALDSHAANERTDSRPVGQRLPYFIECGVCGHEPLNQTERPKHRCSKCHAMDWQRVHRPDIPAPMTLFHRVSVGEDISRPRGCDVVRTAKRVYLVSPSAQYLRALPARSAKAK